MANTINNGTPRSKAVDAEPIRKLRMEIFMMEDEMAAFTKCLFCWRN